MQVLRSQIKRISTLLRLTGLDAQKASLVVGFTSGRTESRKDMTYTEAAELISYLQKQTAAAPDPANQMRRKILAKCHNMGWETTPGKVDMERLNHWCSTKGYLTKPLMEYTAAELPKLVSQFGKVYQSFLKKVS